MDSGSSVSDQFSEVHVEACNLCSLFPPINPCNLCSLYPPINPVVTACNHCFCWPCMYNYLQGQARPCPMCSTMLSNEVNVAPAFDDTLGALVLRLPAATATAEELRLPNCDDDDIQDWSGTASISFEEVPGATSTS